MPKIVSKIAVFSAFAALILATIGMILPSATAQTSNQEFAARSRPHITIHPRPHYPGPNAKRYCRSWLQVQHRLSGTVIVPQMYCWWG
jgi:hypothetical protein